LRVLIQHYFNRWQIEFKHRNEKSLLGVGTLRRDRPAPFHATRFLLWLRTAPFGWLPYVLSAPIELCRHRSGEKSLLTTRSWICWSSCVTRLIKKPQFRII